MITFVTHKWDNPGYRSKFTAAHVNALYAQLLLHCHLPFKMLCFTDNATGIHPDVIDMPLPAQWAGIPNASWNKGPSCYRRLHVFSAEFAAWLHFVNAGSRVVCIDLDVVVCGSLDSLLLRREPFLMWRTGERSVPYCASLIMFDAGKFTDIYTKFDPMKSPKRAVTGTGMRGSDQAWIHYCVGNVPGWTEEDGVYAFNIIAKHGELPSNAKLVIFTGKPDPWEQEAVKLLPVLRHLVSY